MAHNQQDANSNGTGAPPYDEDSGGYLSGLNFFGWGGGTPCGPAAADSNGALGSKEVKIRLEEEVGPGAGVNIHTHDDHGVNVYTIAEQVTRQHPRAQALRISFRTRRFRERSPSGLTRPRRPQERQHLRVSGRPVLGLASVPFMWRCAVPLARHTTAFTRMRSHRCALSPRRVGFHCERGTQKRRWHPKTRHA